MLRAVFAGLILAIVVGSASAQGLDAQAASPMRFGEVPAFELVDASGQRVTCDDLLGAPWIASCFFTACQGPCPRLNGDIRRYLHDGLDGTAARLVSISVDPEHDTPERLSEYAQSYTADPERWLFLTGDPGAVHELVTGGFMLPVDWPEPDDSIDPFVQRLRITHSTRLIVVDAEGLIAGYYECGGEAGLEPGMVEANFAAALARARFLAGGTGAARVWLPRINASLNAVAALLLVLGLLAIRAGERVRHAHLMRAAFLVSAAFLACYVYYHTVVLPMSGGPTAYNGTGWARRAYLAMLASHIILAVVNLPMVLATLWLAHREDWERHKRLARKTFPIWLYVSVTGVLVYVILYHVNPAPGGPLSP
ncbi:MAG: protein SCO1/2 [Chlamydiales bacterium]|jgi:protein SCO1/2